MGQSITLDGFLATFSALLRSHAAVLLPVAIAMTTIDTAVEIALDPTFQIISGLAPMLVAFLLTRRIMRAEGLIEDGGGFVRYFLVSALSTVGMILGAFLLILPGIFIAVRWGAATSLAIARDLRTSEALSESWKLTQPSTKFLMLLYLALGIIYCGLLAGINYLFDPLIGDGNGWATPLATNLILTFGYIVSLVVNVATYIELLGRRTYIEAVFA